MQYRATEHASTGQSPSFLLMGRRVRTKLDLVIPNFQAEQSSKGYKQMERMEPIRQFKEKDMVNVRMYGDTAKWQPGRVKRKIGELHYEVEVQGTVHKRHVDQILRYGVEQDRVGW